MSNNNFNVGLNLQPKKTSFPGIYLGIVEYCADPLQIGRLKIRIPAINGTSELTTTDQLAWATPCVPFGGGHGYGSMMIPPVGSRVVVAFENSDPDYPIWLGTWPFAATSSKKMLRDSRGEEPTGKVFMSPSLEEPWEAPAGPTPPLDYLQQEDVKPEVYVPFKSPKGATIVANDRDEREKFSFIDRAGQCLVFDAPVLEDANKNNENARKMQASSGGNSLPIETTTTQEGTVSLIDIGGQKIELYSKREEGGDRWINRIKLISRQPVTSSGVTPSGNSDTQGNNFVIMDLQGSEGKFTLELSGQPNTLINIDAINGTVTIDTPNKISLIAKDVEIEGNTTITGKTMITDQTIIAKDLIVLGSISSASTIPVSPTPQL